MGMATKLSKGLKSFIKKSKGTPIISDAMNAEHEAMLKTMNRGAAEEGAEEVAEEAAEAGATKGAAKDAPEVEAEVAVEPEISGKKIKEMRKKYGIGPGGVMKKSMPSVREVEVEVKASSPEELKKIRAEMPELEEESDEIVSAVYRYLSKMGKK